MTPISEITTRSAIVRTEGGKQFSVVVDAANTNDPVSDALMAGNFPVPDLYSLLRRSLPGGGRVLDLGAHVGSFSLAAAAAGYEVLAVEASPTNCALLRASIEMNGFTNIRLLNVAVSDRAGTLKFHVHGPYGHVTPGGEGALAIEAVTVDELLSRAGWDAVDFVKLDIEGSEVAAIRGMVGLMSRPDAPLLFCESNGHMLDVFGETPQTLKSALNSAGCKVYLVEPDRLVAVGADELQGQTVVDYLAAKQLPHTLASARVDPGVTEDERLAWLERSAHGSVPERLYAARALRDCSADFRANSKAEAVRLSLEADSTAAISEIARAIPSAPQARRPWWRIF